MKNTLIMLALMSAILVSCKKTESIGGIYGGNNGNQQDEPKYEISISPTELTFGAEGGKRTLTVTAKENENGTSWGMTGETSWKQAEDKKFWYCESAEWCKVSEISGYSGDEITFKISSFNSGVSEKECSFTLYCGFNTEIVLTVKQSIDDTPIIQFSDPAFEKAAIVTADINVDNKISEAEAAYVKSLDLSDKGLSTLEDIKYFVGLEELDCSDNQLTALDISKNTELTYLYCSNNQLTTLDVNNNTALETLSCNDNQLTSLDISKNTVLTGLYCANNQLITLDVSKHTALTTLNCNNNQLTVLDLRNNFINDDPYSGSSLSCSDNPLERIVLSRRNNIFGSDMDKLTKGYGDIITYVD